MKKDVRIKKKHFSVLEILITFLVLSVLTAGQAMIYDSFLDIKNVPLGYIFGIIGYWLLVSLGFSLLTRYQIYRAYDKPMQKFCKATKEVANGDFSIYLEPVHKDGKKDYLDVMFEDFNKMVEELNSIETLKNDFISNVSHEIKTPIAIIQNYADGLNKDNITKDTQKEYIETIITASQKLSALVTNILKLSKLENQEIIKVSEPYDLCRQLSECALSFENSWESKEINFEAEIEDRLIITADESMLEIVWNNLLSNAIKFTEKGRTIRLKQSSESDTAIIIVEDSGNGMDEETLKHIFDKFYQGESTRYLGGNGLGLALTKKVIELLDGEIYVLSEVGKGTRFTVKLKV